MLRRSVAAAGCPRESFQCAYPFAIDLDRHGASQHCNRHNHAPLGLPADDHNPFEPGERALFDADTLAFREIGPRFGRKSGFEHSLDCRDFVVRDRRGLFRDTCNSVRTLLSEDRAGSTTFVFSIIANPSDLLSVT